MAGEETTNAGNIQPEYNVGRTGLNLDQSVNQVAKGSLTYALNAAVENFDSNSVNYQNEPGNEFCLQFPEGFVLIGEHFINEKNKHIFFLANPVTGGSQIGYMDNNDCVYRIYTNANCLNFDVKHPIPKIVHKITNCSTEIYWTDGINPRRYLNIDDIPYLLQPGTSLCDPLYTNELDCNQLKLQPNFEVPQLDITDIRTGGALIAGTYQFAIQYSDATGNPYTSYYSVTNPTPIADPRITTLNFNYEVGKSIVVSISNLDVTGQFQYFNLAVIKTVNDITSVELAGTYFITDAARSITYTGQNVTQIRLTISDIYEKHPYYEIAQDLTTVQDVLVWDNLTSIDRINYQSIASQVQLQWQTYRIPNTENYADELNATNLRGYLRDEVYAFEIVFLLKNGKQTDGFHIPGRLKNSNENLPDVPNTNADFIGDGTSAPYWKIYNTASVIGPATGDPIGNATPYQYGEFAYWESEDEYPCNQDVWGDLAGEKIRHHKFPDVLVSPIFETPTYTYNPNGTILPVQQNDAVFPIGVKIDVAQVESLIASSSLTNSQKADIVAFKIVRGNRNTNRSIVAKGILRNVNSYVREDQTYYYPNYPYNDLNPDPFINVNNNAYSLVAEPWLIYCTQDGEYSILDPNTGKKSEHNKMVAGQTYEVCSLSRPVRTSGGAIIGPGNYIIWRTSGCGDCQGYRINWNSPFTDDNTSYKSHSRYLQGLSSFNCTVLEGQDPFFQDDNVSDQYVSVITTLDGGVSDDTSTCDSGALNFCKCTRNVKVIREVRSTLNCGKNTPQQGIPYDSSITRRQVFNSPETSFGQPFLGDVLKLENVMFGAGKAHFVQVAKNANYKLLSKEAQQDALESSNTIASLPAFDAAGMFTAYQAYLTIYINGITRRNYAYSFNSIASYDYGAPINNNLGIKQRPLEIAQYLIPGVQNVGDLYNINNFQRESSVYLKTKESVAPLPVPSQTPSIAPGGISLITDYSRFTISGGSSCSTPGKELPISVVSYYASMKNIFPNQWGQIYSYETIDTGFQRSIDPIVGSSFATIFGGDTFISRFTFKTKLPYFIDNRVGAPDDSDIFYDEIGNIAYPKYWHSSRSILSDYQTLGAGSPILTNMISYKANNFDCPNDPASIPAGPGAGSERTYYDGYFYLFAYGIPNFYCESSYNTDLRQAFNNREGDFWPHVSTGIPDDWMQESFVTIAQDNTYYYNVTYSKQNKEDFFSHLPPDWKQQLCYTNYPFRAIYSEPQDQNADNRVNSWLVYRPIAAFDFPQNYGALTSLDGIQNRAVLARFENKSLLYNTLLTVQTSNPQAAYLGNDTLFKSSPPIDFAETDLGYVGSQNKMLLKIPQGQVTIDAKRGQVFLITGNQATDLSAFGSGLNRFFTDHLAFEILRYFPKVDTDNHFNNIGLHGVYDSKYDRVIISKLDYIPLTQDVKYDEATEDFYIDRVLGGSTIRTIVHVTDQEYFCNKSWTLSFNMNTNTWISFHSYIPNWYIAENNFFYSGLNGCCDDLTAIAVNEIPIPPTTTTTTTNSGRIVTTSTTTMFIDCELIGTIVQTSCDLEGSAVITVPPTTTTTICQRPTGLIAQAFIYGYTLTGDPEVISSGSAADACAAIAETIDTVCVELSLFTVYAYSYVVGETVYYGDSTDCTLCPDGWYFTYESRSGGFVYHVEGGIITEIFYCNTFTTTTTSTAVPVCYCYTVDVIGTCDITWISCDGTANSQEVINSSITMCAREGSIGGTCEGGSGIQIICGTDICTTDGDCPTTTTTTTVI